MKTIKLDVTNISTVKALHVYLAYALELPSYYGKNLDALHDVLGEIGEQTRIVLAGKPASGEMEAYLPRLVRVLEDAAQENPALHIERDEGLKAKN